MHWSILYEFANTEKLSLRCCFLVHALENTLKSVIPVALELKLKILINDKTTKGQTSTFCSQFVMF